VAVVAAAAAGVVAVKFESGAAIFKKNICKQTQQ